MPEKATASTPRKGWILRLLRILAWLLIVVSLVCVAIYLAFGPARMIDRLKPSAPVFPEHVTEAPQPPETAAPVTAPPSAPAETRELVNQVMDSTEDIWGEFLARGDFAYRKPKLELYEGRVDAGCKNVGTASGPFYCPDGKRLYLDLAFLDELGKRLPEASAFAKSYVVAHEVGHHVQNLTGVNSWINDYRARGEITTDLETAQELQADCLAGIWITYAQRKYPWVQPDQMDKVLKAVAALTQERAKAKDQPPMADQLAASDVETRMHWFRVGVETGDPRECTLLFSGMVQ
ncbi:neutral zinc metallopeptidase [Pseudomonas sp. LFM046]|uniref:neutral zinc metallopeptidase n=1 Tax=Pseudomonas sp. LFM046 TaxID=1608357 RepID=UPI00069730F0|nr:neutral zinc metallopeptidase [Pseudomonas sp. LFM046]